jgi:hypothetical protein
VSSYVPDTPVSREDIAAQCHIQVSSYVPDTPVSREDIAAQCHIQVSCYVPDTPASREDIAAQYTAIFRYHAMFLTLQPAERT